nr:mitochondrial pyruvate carrier 4 [Ipomoea batatas]GMC93507.1 mitochondrial pyruvate carrier 4 [Ipomoea batatas]
MATSKLQALWNHPAGPKTIHFWAPTFKWGISIANIADFSKPPEKLSYPQQIAVTATGVIWSRYSTVITPSFCYLKYNSEPSWFLFQIIDSELQKNWNLFSVNVAMAGTGIYQLTRKIRIEGIIKPAASDDEGGKKKKGAEEIVINNVDKSAETGVHGSFR